MRAAAFLWKYCSYIHVHVLCVCVSLLPFLSSDVDFQELYHTASLLKSNYAERKAWFPDFSDSDLIIGEDVWNPDRPQSDQYVCRDLRQGCCMSSDLAGSPDEENPPSSVTPSVAPGKPNTTAVYMYSASGAVHLEISTSYP